MILNIDSPVFNTIVVFSIIMILLYTIKPEVIYDHEKAEFRQFGTTERKTLLPIYVISILLAMILYIFFYYMSKQYTNSKECQTIKVKEFKDDKTDNSPQKINKNIQINETDYLRQQLQIQNLQHQLEQLINRQQIELLNKKTSNVINSCLPNHLNV